MNINIFYPDDQQFLGLTACGRIQANSDLARQVLALNSGREIATEEGADDNGMTLCAVWGKKADRLHIDYVRSSEFKKWKIDVEGVSMESMQNDLGKLTGQRISGTFMGRYVVPISSIPPSGIIAFLSFETKSGKMSMSMTGAELAISGAPVDSLSWKLDRTKKHVTVDLRGKINREINSDYLTDLRATLDMAFKILVAQERPDGNL